MRPNLSQMRPVLVALMRSGVALVGVALTTISALLFLVLFFIQELGFSGGLYLGLISFLGLPVLFVLGLLLIPFGIWLHRARERKRAAAGQEAARAPVIDFKIPRIRILGVVIAVFTFVNLLILGAGSYKAVQVMDSTEFCGGACHSVMSPEMTAHQVSPHSSVGCTECHIGSGADSFVKAKLSGTRQLWGLMTGRFHRPVPTPVHNMRPASETCESCHSRSRWIGDQLRVHSHFAEDEKQTEKKTVLLVNVGGKQDGQWKGIHAHNNPAHAIRFRADPTHQQIYEVAYSDGKTTKTFKTTATTPETPDAQWRSMDCTDCHNRPAHSYRLANDEIEAALSTKRLDPALPFIKQQGMKALQTRYASQADAQAGIRLALMGFYEKQYLTLFQSDRAKIESASNTLVDIYARNVFPEMKIGWGTYAIFANHNGCFRCHDNEHLTEIGEKLSQKCELCHQTLATDEADPEVLQVLYP
jgi:hypothetical protein